jgi:hypothetical protein
MSMGPTPPTDRTPCLNLPFPPDIEKMRSPEVSSRSFQGIYNELRDGWFKTSCSAPPLFAFDGENSLLVKGFGTLNLG